MPTTEFLPSLSNLIPVENIPDNFGIIKDGLVSTFSHLYYRNLQVDKSESGDSGFYKLNIRTYKKLALEIPGTDGLALILNPAIDDDGITHSEFDISLSYIWHILKYSKDFDLDTFNWTPKVFFYTILDIANITPEDLLSEAIRSFIDDPDPIQKFIEIFNETYNVDPELEAIEDEDESVVITNLVVKISTLYINEDIEDDVFTVVFNIFLNVQNELGNELDHIEAIFVPFLGNFTVDNIKELLIPQVSAFLNDLSVGLQFPRSVLIPLNDNDGDGDYGKPLSEPARSILKFDIGTLSYSTQDGLSFEELSKFSFTYSQIGNTGLTLRIENVKLDLSRTTNISEASADGRPDDFVGVFVEYAEIGLPKQWSDNGTSAKIFGKNLIIGTGGLSGTIGLQDGAGTLNKTFGNGFAVELDAFDLTFRQNVITGSHIKGALTIPGFKDKTTGLPKKVGIDVGIKGNGDFYITAKPEGGFTIAIPNVLEYTVKSLSVGQQGDKYFLSTSGNLAMTMSGAGGLLSKFLPKDLALDQFIIWSDGSFEIKGGSIKLKEPVKISLGPAKISVTAIHMGSYEKTVGGTMRKYRYIGFDGGIAVNPGGVDARGDGVKIYFTVDGGPFDLFVRIQGLAIDLIIPGSASADSATAVIKGFLSMRDPDPDYPSTGTEYIGGVDVSLPKIGLRIASSMRMAPSVPAFVIDASVELPSPIPLASTGLGLYGFRGLLGMRYIVSKQAAKLPADASWYEYYQAKVAPQNEVGVNVSKMSQRPGFTIGAGLSFGTLDTGYTFSAKLMVLFSDKTLYIEGKLALLRTRVGLDTQNDPPFFIILAIDETAVESAIGANFKIPQSSGAVLDVFGIMEMKYFFNDSSAWYINVGRETPPEKRIRAKILSLFEAYSYLMLSAGGIRAGAGLAFNFDKGIGPLRVYARFWMDIAGRLSFKPLQLGGSISAGGEAGIKVFMFNFNIAVGFYLGAEVPKPFYITGKVYVSVSFRLFRKKRNYGGELELTWIFNRDRDLSEQLVLDYTKGVKAVNMLTGEDFAIKAFPYPLTDLPAIEDQYTIPLDSFIDIQFEKSVRYKGSNEQIINFFERFGIIQGADNSEVVPPQPSGISAQVRHRYYAEKIELKYWNGSSWQPYLPEVAMLPLDTSNIYNDIEVLGPSKQLGSWQWKGAQNNNLRLAATTPFDYSLRSTSPVRPDELGFSETNITCALPKKAPHELFFDDNFPFAQLESEKKRSHKEGVVMVKGQTSQIIDSAAFSHTKALSVNAETEVFVFFDEPTKLLKITANGNGQLLEVNCYRRQQVPEQFMKNGVPLYENTLVHSFTYVSETNEQVLPDGKWADFISLKSTGGDCADFVLTELSEIVETEINEGVLLEDTDEDNCLWLFYGLKWNTLEEHAYNTSLPSQPQVNGFSSGLAENISKRVKPIWRPNTVYALSVATLDDLEGKTNYSHEYTFAFKTAGPVGHFHQKSERYKQLLAEKKEETFQLAYLRSYIDYTRSYPNADGNIINAKPLYRNNPKLLLFFKENYMYTMFNPFRTLGGLPQLNSSIEVAIKDPATGTLFNLPKVLPEAKKWTKSSDPIVPESVRVVKNIVEGLQNEGLSCAGDFPEGSFTPLQLGLDIQPQFNLEPSKAYTALFQASYHIEGQTQPDLVEVHKYLFQSSQYESLEKHIQSFVLDPGSESTPARKAIFQIDVTLDEESLTAARSVMTKENQPELLISSYAERFDRLFDGAMKMKTLPPPVTTEFNLISQHNEPGLLTQEDAFSFLLEDGSGRLELEEAGLQLLGVLVRSPEPFADPKLIETSANTSEKTLQDVLKLEIGVDDPKEYQVLFSKDKASAFVSTNSLHLRQGNGKFTFNHILYNGDVYATVATEEDVEVDLQLS